MRFEHFNGGEFLVMLVGSSNLLAEHRAEIDALNVFPVPDGDTGTNMYLTLLAGVKKARENPGRTVGEVASAVAEGALLGARGNSGVILSQILQGIASVLEGREEVSVSDVAAAYRAGSDAAYRAVTSPVEGTMLTVTRRIAEAYEDSSRKNYDLLRATLHSYKTAQQALAETPEMLPVLKQAGVVDAGGRGMVVMMEGILYALKMAAARQELKLFDLAASQQKEFVGRQTDFSTIIQYSYCTELVVRGGGLPLERMKEELSPYGDCLMVVGGGETAKVHIHSNHPGLVLECCLKYGVLHSVHINNMEEQHQEMKQRPAQERPLGVVAVGLGEGIISIMESLGVDVVVPGGQTMNPSAEDLLEAVRNVPAQKVLVLPNNKNVILTARQSAEMSEKEVRVVPTVSMPQGLAAMMGFNPFGDIDEIAEKMMENAAEIQYGEVTRAVRDTAIGGKPVSAGDYIGLLGDELTAGGGDFDAVVEELLGRMINSGTGLVTLYHGADMNGKAVDELSDRLGERFPGVDFEYHYGGQPHYQLIISAE
ncbi:dihydroxyacetone kinase family protein [Desulfocucumis palustris]|uniref:Dihydroxyacetone kinase family protein n=1 Tax=Desulfocucumis palustris TaxID=1898651 RepID=A0A2L2XC93_9FIRM|nr:DAK2 domain-containing protein [Desulfocucumis palustris]GBF33858.1 dihydroxyacetone kinase family protein [Desulfocucumis palustris]